ncbi:glycosyltransferase [Microbacterium sp. SORGH_AS_0505]|uniref:glycosyltransferase n=1 Tax=Microbacterium sp. SORGH_AS_0505 TaxID=3041770 RepID=UPI0035943ECF
MIQTGHFRSVFHADTAILDLNPRSLTAWALLLARRGRRRRTLLWGHLHPRAGRQSSTARVRRWMRSLADGTVLYGYDSVTPAGEEVPGQPVWVAPNSLYRRDDMGSVGLDQVDAGAPRAIYVGRLVASKKVDLAIKALADPVLSETGLCLDIVGDGVDSDRLRRLAGELGVQDRVSFHGGVTNPDDLKKLYSRAVCSLSPGYAGLSLTQSLGFGVPVVVADDEPHAPEIELVTLGGVHFFPANSATGMASVMAQLAQDVLRQPRDEIATKVMNAYSAEAMAGGLADAFLGRSQSLNADGWPIG